VFEWWIKNDRPMKFYTSMSSFNFTNRNIQFINKRKYAYIFSGTLALLGLVSILTRGFDYGVDFTGGRSYVVRFEQNVNTSDVRLEMERTTHFTPVVKTYGSDNQVKITTQYMMDAKDSVAEAGIYNSLKKFVGKDVTQEEFTKKYVQSTSVVGATISDDIRNSAYKAVFVALIAIGLYILVRFRKWQYAVGVIVALAHDVLMVMGIFSLFKGILPFPLEVDETFIAAALTVIGYSVNDTVIVFDRIRENLREHASADMKKTINDAINQTLNRTIITSLTVFLVLLILFIFGGDGIRGFSFAMLIGVVFGTYSSIFVATPLVIDFTKDTSKLLFNEKDEKKKAHEAMAQAK
ncbi:MAG: protein translocase subunit SecF, partial [Bacteroidota bacterium]